MSTTLWPYIEIDSQGVARVLGTTCRVVEIVADHLAYAWDAEEIHRQYPHLSLSQIHSALGYYYEHKAACDQTILEEIRQIEVSHEAQRNNSLYLKLKTAKQGQ